MLGCRVVRGAADKFNGSAPDRWRRLRRRAYQETVRKHGPKSVRPLARVWEVQTRGVLHIHPVLGYRTHREKTGARAYLKRLAELAPACGFGFVDHDPAKVKAHPATGAAAYLSSYFVKGRGRKAALLESVRSGAMPASIIHVSVQLTQQTRCTMRNLRLRRGLYVVWGARPSMEETHLVGAFFEVFRGNVELVRHYDGRRAPPHLLPTAPGRSVPRMDLADCALGAHGPFGPAASGARAGSGRGGCGGSAPTGQLLAIARHRDLGEVVAPRATTLITLLSRY
jgi:hypothetical protein